MSEPLFLAIAVVYLCGVLGIVAVGSTLEDRWDNAPRRLEPRAADERDTVMPQKPA